MLLGIAVCFHAILVVMMNSVRDAVLCRLLVLGFAPAKHVGLQEEVDEEDQICDVHECGKDENARIEVALDLE